MIPQPDYGHFYKFAVSLGLILIALAALVPVLVLRDSGTLKMPASEVKELTPAAERIVHAKQRQQRWIQDNYRWISGTLAIAGTAVVIFGAVKWARRQAVLDELEDTDLARRKLELKGMTPQEVEQKEVEEALVEVAEERTDAASDASPAASPELADPRAGRPTAERDRVLEIQVERRGAEASLAALLRRAFADTHLVEQHVRVGRSMRSSLEADFLLISTSARFVSHAVEFKYVTSMKSIRNRLIEGITQAEAVARAASQSQQTPYRALLVLSVSEEVELLPTSVDTYREVVGEYRTTGINLEVILTRRSIMDAMSADVFRQLVEIGNPSGSGFSAMI